MTASGLTANQRQQLAEYVRDVATLPNESAKSHRFAALIGQCFPASPIVQQLAQGTEHRLRIDLGIAAKHGRIDTYVGNAVIEFEDSLAKTGAHARDQLKEYVAGIWQKEDSGRPLLAIATDGLKWVLFRPVLSPGKKAIVPSRVELEELRTLTVSADPARLAEFWQWLTGLLFLEGTRAATADNLKFDFGVGSPTFTGTMGALRHAWDSTKQEPEFALKRTTWARYLTVTYGTLAAKKDELDRLFLTHTYLAALARFLVWGALRSKGKSLDFTKTANDVLTGEFFVSHRIENLVEEDFFAWINADTVKPELLPAWQLLLAQLSTYDLSHAAHQDLLKGLYQELVDPKDRHELGEFYTPDWLCEAVIEEVVTAPDEDRILDPSCGSGSFLRAAIAQIVGKKKPSEALLYDVLDRVAGIDIHPLAVTVSKATFALTLGPMLALAKRPVRLPVYLADSLFLPVEVEQLELGTGRVVGIRIGTNTTVSMPDELVKASATFDASISACQTVATDHAKSKKETRQSLAAYLKKQVPGLAKLSDGEAATNSLWEFTDALAQLIRKRQDSIWAFIVRNAYRPAMLKGQFNVLAGNPPWLSYHYIADSEYQNEVRRRGMTEYGLFPKEKALISQFELAALFLVHCLSTFGRPGDSRLGFVMPHSVWSADQHAKLREGKYNAPVTVTGLWELKDVRPLFNVPSGVVFARYGQPDAIKHKTLPLRTFKGTLPAHNVSWDGAKSHLAVKDGTARRIYLGKRSAWSDVPGSPLPTSNSPYLARFFNGATLYPRSCFFVTGDDVEWPPEPDALYSVATDEEQAKTAKAPYNTIRMAGQVEGAFLFRTALSKHVFPFLMTNPALVVLPIEPTHDGCRVLTADMLVKQGNRKTAQWMKIAEGHWAKGNKGKMTIEENLDYQGKLASQPVPVRWLVLYNASGMNVSAAVVDTDEWERRFVVENKTFWVPCETADEAHYVAAVLNADAVNAAIKPFQSLGLLGERDIHKKPLELPIPAYKASNATHGKLAMLGKDAATKARAFFPKAAHLGLGPARSAVREAVAGELAEIDTLVVELLRGEPFTAATSPAKHK